MIFMYIFIVNMEFINADINSTFQTSWCWTTLISDKWLLGTPDRRCWVWFQWFWWVLFRTPAYWQVLIVIWEKFYQWYHHLDSLQQVVLTPGLSSIQVVIKASHHILPFSPTPRLRYHFSDVTLKASAPSSSVPGEVSRIKAPESAAQCSQSLRNKFHRRSWQGTRMVWA